MPRSQRATEIRREGKRRRRGDKETRCFSAFLLVPLSPCLLVLLSLCLCVFVAISSVLAFPDLDRGELDGALVRTGKTDDQNIAFAQMRGGYLKIFEAANRPAIGFEDDVAGRETRIGRGTYRVSAQNDHAAHDPVGTLPDTQIAQGLGSVLAHGEPEQKVGVLPARLPSFIGSRPNFGRVGGNVDGA